MPKDAVFTRNFYQDLNAFSDFSKAFDPVNYQLMPDDWWIVVADIIDSTKAVEAGEYKKVNFVGSLPIIASINLLSSLQFPFVFGGDGATLLIPDDGIEQVLGVLTATAQAALRLYGLQYRLGAVKVQSIRQQGRDVQIAKFNVSAHYQQAFFMGGGLELAEVLVKQQPEFQTDINRETGIEPDFSGLECRWEDIPSQRGLAVSLLVKACDDKDGSPMQVYQNLMQAFENIAGSKADRSVVTKQGLNLSLSPKQLIYEAKAFSSQQKPWKRIVKMAVENLLVKFLMKCGFKDWGFYKENLIRTTDAEKFDDTLRMVIAVTAAQQEQLIVYLEDAYQAGRIIYGMHTSDRALMTCLIFKRHGQQVHFLDAAEGGYALASKDFKRRQPSVP